MNAAPSPSSTATQSPADALPRAHPLARAAWALLGLVGAWVVVTSARLHADGRGFGTHEQLGLPPCTFSATTGVPCPGCGLTTSFTAMAHGHVVTAFRAHLMGPLLFALTVAVTLYAPYAVARARPLSAPLWWRASVPALMVTAGAGLLTFVLRLAHVLHSG